jgi:xanthosine utilization system XapX-like protein
MRLLVLTAAAGLAAGFVYALLASFLGGGFLR